MDFLVRVRTKHIHKRLQDIDEKPVKRKIHGSAKLDAGDRVMCIIVRKLVYARQTKATAARL